MVIITKLNIHTSHYNYNIHIGNKLNLEEFFIDFKDKKMFIITDDNVFKLYEKYLNESFKSFNYKFIVVNEGEGSKSFETYNNVIDTLLEKEMKKDDLLIAFGGGVVGDLTGFIAGTIFRGVNFVNIPTSLLSMADSSIGGKTAIDTKYGKNLVGVFKQPLFVIIDTNYLRTLNNIEYTNGMAEIIKAGLILDKKLIDYLLSDNIDEQKMIIKALKVKKYVVEKDPFEENYRMVLNFGHTFGHAIEQYHNYEIKHGFCVGLGMDLAIRLGIKLEITDEKVLKVMKALYERHGLKEFQGDSNKYIDNIKYDKKNINNKIHFIIIKDIAEVKIITVNKEDLYDLSN